MPQTLDMGPLQAESRVLLKYAFKASLNRSQQGEYYGITAFYLHSM